MNKDNKTPVGWMKHGTKISVTIDGKTFLGHIEERFVGPWPEKRTALYVLIDDMFPHFPIPIIHFQPNNKEIYQYGIITKLSNYNT